MLRTAVRKGLASELTAPDAAACSRDRSVRIAAVLGDAILRVLASWRHGKKLPPWAQPSAGHNAGGGFRVRKTKHPSSMPSSNQGPRRFGSPQLQARAASSAMSQLLHAVRIRVCFPMQLAGAPLKTAS
eukprot:scaffold31431_cov101-Isochrysis_galbana.AAC.2